MRKKYEPWLVTFQVQKCGCNFHMDLKKWDWESRDRGETLKTTRLSTLYIHQQDFLRGNDR